MKVFHEKKRAIKVIDIRIKPFYFYRTGALLVVHLCGANAKKCTSHVCLHD